MSRAWFYDQMADDAGFMALAPGGVHASTKLQEAPELKPFLMYRAIAHRPRNRGDDADITREETFLLFVHDVPGSYVKIDALLEALRTKYVNRKDTDNGISRCFWVEDSEDFRDEDMGTILRYARITVRYLP